MTNKKKAVEIANTNMESYCVLFDDGCLYDVISNSECYDSAIEMAEWKDQQFIQFLEDRMGDEISVKMIEEFKCEFNLK